MSANNKGIYYKVVCNFVPEIIRENNKLIYYGYNSKNEKYVYSFGGGKTDGNESMKNLLGGKGANLAEMAGHKDLKLPVPPGFTITTEVCTYFYDNKDNILLH